jgi:hypothetical protein
MPRWILLALVVLACTPAERPIAPEAAPLGSANPAEPPPPEEDASCEDPEAIPLVEANAQATLDADGLDRSVAIARDFAERCCNGEASQRTTARVVVTLHASGYATDVAVEGVPEASPAHACLYGSFHRVLGKAFTGPSITRTASVRVRP